MITRAGRPKYIPTPLHVIYIYLTIVYLKTPTMVQIFSASNVQIDNIKNW